MKLRLQSNSVRLRLKQAEVARLIETGMVEESIRFLPGDEALIYRLELSESAKVASARLKGNAVIVEIPIATARQWAENAGQVGIEAVQPAGADAEHAFMVLVEKDFACLDGSDEQNADTFPNPLAGTKC